MMQQGVTLIELLLVIGLMLIVGMMASPFISQFLTYNSFDIAEQQLQGNLRKAQAYAMDGKQPGPWGVCLSDRMIRLFSGTCASPTHHEDFELPTTVTVTGLNTVTFNNRGEPSAALSITITTPLETATMVLNQSGGLSVN
ncbi:MAG TPA: prepilin-type N-terminal cleavage/methylation domain-containing protein [Vitreimonas sp.]|nr:prepilin-type N-terminal cleavage/methylation domain-containing protein [Vitreimonas sp.]